LLTQENATYTKNKTLPTELAISEVALQAGFAHQSHLARHMRRILGCTPKSLKHELQQRD
jgi:AraC family transcriptional regulator